MPVPHWLEPYAPAHDLIRETLTSPQKLLFDSLWDRACGDVQPFLSMGERDKLIGFFDVHGVAP